MKRLMYMLIEAAFWLVVGLLFLFLAALGTFRCRICKARLWPWKMGTDSLCYKCFTEHV